MIVFIKIYNNIYYFVDKTKISVVDLNGKSIDLKVSSSSKFIDVKNMVEDFFDIEVNKQKFRVNDLMLKDEDDGKYFKRL